MATILRGPRSWSMSTDKDGHRTYKIQHVVMSTNPISDGPATVMTTAGLPQPGDYWNFGGDTDIAALFSYEQRITSSVTDEASCIYVVESTFTTRPAQRCMTNPTGNPLLEPQRISGSFVNHTREMTHDRHGNRFKNSAHQQLRGSIVEFDVPRAQVQIQQNVASLELPLVTSLMHHVNSSTMWGMPPRTIKLSGFGWTQMVTDVCTYFYDRSFMFDVVFEGFDRTAMDEGTKVLKGHWAEQGENTGTGSGTVISQTGWIVENIDGAPADPDNPSHFIHYLDRDGNPTDVLLDGYGKPVEFDPTGTGGGTPGQIDISYYPSGNLFLLGIPVSL